MLNSYFKINKEINMINFGSNGLDSVFTVELLEELFEKVQKNHKVDKLLLFKKLMDGLLDDTKKGKNIEMYQYVKRREKLAHKK